MASENLSQFLSGKTLEELTSTKAAKYVYNVRRLKMAENDLKSSQRTYDALVKTRDDTRKKYEEIGKVGFINRIKNAGEIRRRKKLIAEQIERLNKSINSFKLKIQAATSDVKEFKGKVDAMVQEMKENGVDPQEVDSGYNRMREELEEQQTAEKSSEVETMHHERELTQTEKEVLADFQAGIEQPTETFFNELHDDSFDGQVQKVLDEKEREKNGSKRPQDEKSQEEQNYGK